MSIDEMTFQANNVVAQLVAGAPDTGRSLNELYNLIWDGADCNILRKLLSSGQDELETGAAWIMSEMHSQCRCLLDCVLALSRDPRKRVRAYAVDFIVNQREELTADARTGVQLLMADTDSDVRAYAQEMFAKVGLI